MTRSSSRIWNSNADEVDEFREKGLWSDSWARRHRNRIVDLWVSWDLHAATQAIHLGRYRDTPELRQAIVDLRQAAQRVADLMRRDVAARKEENK